MNMNEDQRSALQKGAVILACEVSGSTGERIIPDSQGYFEGDVLKNENVSKSSIRWLPRELIRFRNRINGAAQRVLTDNGVSYYGGATLIPANLLPAVEKELKMLQEEFEDEALRLESSLDIEVERHKQTNPEIAHLIQRFRQSGREFASKFRFRVMPPTNLDFVNGNASDGVAKDMAHQLIEEVAKEAASLFKKVWSVAEKATPQTLKGVQKLHKKLSNLSFIDESIEPIAEAFEAAILKFPKAFPVTGEPVQEMAKFVAAASNPDTLRNFGKEAEELDEEVKSEDIFNTDTSDEDIAAETSTPEPQQTESAEPKAPESQSEPDEVPEQPMAEPEPKSEPEAVTKPESESFNQSSFEDDEDEDDGLGWGSF
ncbi:DUF3150 domain-containing protein [Aliidiomarina quisquiliarum]|uniref:DUF3150 domain-containing protein n=1 Tax=Aliidiomarina quisquiliarum TaxID=2938947 RepID=UPI00208EF52F|nr:DUF3150 domain-containing protein [Aliidiomarina quisquiliarum]MCO4320012.1 DUF3150 domain-containing protein [Aliidiomarina quisquiliarum]